MKRYLAISILMLTCLLSGCATTTNIPLESARLIDNVPFFKQNDYQCGPSALAGVINYWYIKKAVPKNLTVEEIVAAIYSPSARGILGIDLESYAREKGFQVKQYKGSIADIKENIDGGTPLILFVEYGFFFYQLNHFIVAKGYTEKSIIVNSGRKENELIPNGELEKIWRKTGYWSLLIKPSS